MKNNNYDPNTEKYNWGSKWEREFVTEKQAAYITVLAQQVNVKIINTDQMKRGTAAMLITELKRVADGDTKRYLIRDWSKYVVVEA